MRRSLASFIPPYAVTVAEPRAHASAWLKGFAVTPL
jgi:hypothetical protein